MVRVVLLANLNHAEIDYALYIEVAMIVDTLLMCVRIHLWLHAPGFVHGVCQCKIFGQSMQNTDASVT